MKPSRLSVPASLAMAAVFLLACGENTSAPTEPSTPQFAKGGKVQQGTQADVTDGQGVSSDGQSTYVKGEQCVFAGSAQTGFWQLRTIANKTECKLQVRGVWRFLRLDMGAGNTNDLDQDGSAGQFEDVPVRFFAVDLFASNSGGFTPVSIDVVTVNADGTTTQDTKWSITYRNEAPIVINPDGSRTIALGGTDARADVCENVEVTKGKGRTKTECQDRGTVDLSFEVNVQN